MTDEELNDRIRDYCLERNVAFKPWEWPRPWEIRDGEPSPYPPGSQSAGAVWWPKALALRAKIIKALRAAQTAATADKRANGKRPWSTRG